MKILHISDTHLGYAAYRKSTEDGINQREMDVYNTFEEFIKYSIKNKPDLIIHAGDLFDSVRPNNRAITFAVKELVKLSKENIPIVIISGNHEQPKLKETGHIFSVFDHIENVYPIYSEKYEKIDFEIKDKRIIIHAIPQTSSKKDFEIELRKLKPDKKADINIFTAHGSVTGVKNFSMNEFNELIIPTRVLCRNFDYIALGHFHSYTKLETNAFYSGAIESLTFAEANENKGFIELEVNNKKIKTNFIKLNSRPMLDTKPIKCSELKIDQIMKRIKDEVKNIKPDQKTIRITLDDIAPNIYRNLDFNEIKKEFRKATHFEIKANIRQIEDKKIKQTSSKIDALVNEYKKFLEGQEIDDKKTLLDMGIGYIEKVQAKKEGK